MTTPIVLDDIYPDTPSDDESTADADEAMAAGADGHPTAVDWPIQAVAVGQSILTTARSDRLAAINGQWGQGVARRGTVCDGLFGWPGGRCGDPDMVPDPPYPADGENKPDPAQVTYSEFYPFFLGNHMGGCCDDLLNQPRLIAWTAEDLNLFQAKMIAAEFYSGYYGRSSSLQHNAVDITPGVVHSLEDGLGEITDRMPAVATWHIGSRLAPAMQRLGLVNRDGARPVGPMGWPISWGPGYPISGGPKTSKWRPDVTSADCEAAPSGNSPDAADGEAWIYAHLGVVDAAVAELPTRLTSGRTYDQRTNYATELYERFAIVAANLAPCTTFAVRVRTSTCCP